MPDVPILLDHANPVPLHERPGYPEALRTAQSVQGFSPNHPCGIHPRKTPIVHRGRG